MSDYLTSAANRAEPSAAPAIRPRLRTSFESQPSPAPAEKAVEPAAVLVREVPDAANPAAPGRPSVQVVSTAISSASRPAEDRETERESVAAEPLPSHPTPFAAPLLISRNFVEKADAPRAVRVPESPADLADAKPAVIFPLTPPAVSKQKETAELVSPRAAAPSTPQRPLLESPKAALPVAAAQSAPAPPPAVNITIGRLEIRAAPQPEKPRAQPQATGRGPLALDDFLRSKTPRPRRT